MLRNFWKLMYFPKFDHEYCLKVQCVPWIKCRYASFICQCWDCSVAMCIWYARSSTEVSADDMREKQSSVTAGHTERKDTGSHSHIKHTRTVLSWHARSVGKYTREKGEENSIIVFRQVFAMSTWECVTHSSKPMETRTSGFKTFSGL